MLKFNISTKFVTAFALLLTVMAAMGTIAITKLSAVDAIAAEQRDRWLPAATALGELHAYTSQYRLRQDDMFNATSPGSVTRAQKLLRNARYALEGNLAEYEKFALLPQQKLQVSAIRTAWTNFIKVDDDLQARALNGDAAGVQAFHDSEGLDTFYALEDAISQLSKLTRKRPMKLPQKARQSTIRVAISRSRRSRSAL